MNILSKLLCRHWCVVICALISFSFVNVLFAQERTYHKAIMTGVKVPRGIDIVELTIVDKKQEEFLCTGTFITDRIIITAAHCLEGNPIEVGATLSGRYVVAHHYLLHPRYSSDESGVFVNDVALIFFSNAQRVKTTAILSSKAPLRGQSISFYGFGVDERGNVGTLRKGVNKISGIFKGYFSIRYTRGTSNSCEGDSGGPVVRDIRDSNNAIIRTIMGITSSGDKEDCSYGDSSYFISLSSSSVVSFLKANAPKAKFK
jgi:secreted trypsin-like serine protease